MTVSHSKHGHNDPKPTTFKVHVNVQGGKSVALDVDGSVTLDQLRLAAIQAAGIVEQPGERWQLAAHHGHEREIAQPGETVAALAERLKERGTLQFDLEKDPVAG